MRAGNRHPGTAARHGAAPAARQVLGLTRHVLGIMLCLAVITMAAVRAHALTLSARAAGIAAQGDTPFNGTAAVGALFTQSHGRLGGHFCTASVVHSPTQDLLITAAHCMTGRSVRPWGHIVFAPGYRDGRFPHGIWDVTAVYVDSAWAGHRDPNLDVAFLVAGLPGTHIERHTGAETLKAFQPPQRVRAIGYPDAASRPVACTTRARSFGHGHQMVFGCAGFTDGTSGGPFLIHVSRKTGNGSVIGVIGGYELGGDTPSVSYSPRFFSWTLALYQTAVRRARAADG